MLAKVYRLIRDKDYNRVFRKGASSYDKILGVRAVKNELEHSRLGIMVSTKVSKKAVERNKIKRRIREIIKIRFGRIKKGYDYVVVSLPEAKNKEYKELEESIDRQFRKLKLYV